MTTAIKKYFCVIYIKLIIILQLYYNCQYYIKTFLRVVMSKIEQKLFIKL